MPKPKLAAIQLREELPFGKTTTIRLPPHFLKGWWYRPLGLIMWPDGEQRSWGGWTWGPFELLMVRIGGRDQMPAGGCGFGPQDSCVPVPVAWDPIGVDKPLEVDVRPIVQSMYLECTIECDTIPRTDEPPCEDP